MATKTTIEMAREAAGDDWGLFQEYMPEIHRLAELVRADERARMATDKSKEAMKLALEALENIEERCTLGAWEDDAGKAITALREALAEQPAQQVVDSEEKAGAYMEARLWEFIDMAAAWPKASPDPRTWDHVVVYAPKPAQRTWVGLTDEQKAELVFELFSDGKAASKAMYLLTAHEAKLKEKNNV